MCRIRVVCAIVVATIPEGKNKPYHDNIGIIWVKNSADKRKVFDNSELAVMMGDSVDTMPMKRLCATLP